MQTSTKQRDYTGLSFCDDTVCVCNSTAASPLHWSYILKLKSSSSRASPAYRCLYFPPPPPFSFCALFKKKNGAAGDHIRHKTDRDSPKVVCHAGASLLGRQSLSLSLFLPLTDFQEKVNKCVGLKTVFNTGVRGLQLQFELIQQQIMSLCRCRDVCVQLIYKACIALVTTWTLKDSLEACASCYLKIYL